MARQLTETRSNMNGKLSPRRTEQRQLILEITQQAEGHLDADEIYQQVRQKRPSISLSTVYHGLQLFKEMGLLILSVDGPPGIGCPVISSLSGANLSLLVTEPTLSGIHDQEKVLDVCRYFGIPVLVCIKKYDLMRIIPTRLKIIVLVRG